MIASNGRVVKKPRSPSHYIRAFSMAFVSKADVQCAAFVSCRDYMHDQVRTFLNGGKRHAEDGHPYNPSSGDPYLNMDILSLLVMIPNSKVGNFELGLKALNDMETYAEMPLTTAEFVTRAGVSVPADYVCILLTGDGEYMHNPHLLSIITLTLRFCTLNPTYEYKKLGDLTAWYNGVKVGKDGFLMGRCHSRMHLVLRDRKDLFGNLSLKELFPMSIGYGFHSKGGIHELCNGNSANKEVNKKVLELPAGTF